MRHAWRYRVVPQREECAGAGAAQPGGVGEEKASEEPHEAGGEHV